MAVLMFNLPSDGTTGMYNYTWPDACHFKGCVSSLVCPSLCASVPAGLCADCRRVESIICLLRTRERKKAQEFHKENKIVLGEIVMPFVI